MSAWLHRLFFSRLAERDLDGYRRKPRFVVNYDCVVSVSTQSDGAAAACDGRALAIVSGTSGPKWLMFRCPCGCGEVRRINVAKAIQPAWNLRIAPGPSVSLYPSVWLRSECRAHFILRDNRAYVF